MPRIIVSVTNDLVADQRVNRICFTLHNLGYEVLLIGRRLDSMQEPGLRVYKYRRFKMIFKKGFLFYASFNTRLFFKLLFSRADIFLSNDLDTLPANYFASIIRKKKLIYDSHELFTEVPELIRRPKVQNIWLKFERHILPKLNSCYTVSKPIADYYNQLYDSNFQVIKNLPCRKPQGKNITERESLLIYQGALNINRGLEMLIESMQEVNNAKLYIAGSGDIEAELHEICENLELSDKVEFFGRIPLEDLNDITKNAKLGFSLEEDSGLNYRYALPNKIFDYIQAGVPTLVSALPEMQKIISEYNTGEIFLGDTSTELANQINDLLSEPEKLDLYHNNCIKAANVLCWENESIKLTKIVENC